MKNNILLLALFALLTASAQNSLTSKTVGTVKTSASVVTLQTPKYKSPETKAMETIARSEKENAERNGITNPSKIQIGNTLSFKLENGDMYKMEVEKGDNQYNMLVEFFTNNRGAEYVPDSEEQQPVSTAVATTAPPAIENYPVVDFLANDDIISGVPNIFPLLLAIALLVGAYKFYAERKKEKAARLERERIENDPTLAGPPVYGNGITDGNAVEVMTNAVTTIHPDLAQFPIKILKMEKGTINSETAEVYFGGQRSKKSMIINNVRGVRATVIIGDEPEERIVYALQACGNPLKDGDFVIGRKIQFTPDTLGAVIQIPQVEVVVEKPEEKGNQVAEALLKAIAAGERTGNATIQFTMLPTGHCSLNVVFTRLMLPPHIPVKENETTAEVSNN